MIYSALLTGFVVRVFPAAVSGKKKPWSWDQYLEDERSQAAPLQLFTEVHTTDPGSALSRSLHTETVLLWDARLYDQLWVALYTQRPSYSEMHGCMISSESLSTHRDRLTLRCTAVWSALSRSLHTETVFTLRCTAVWSALSRSLHTETVLLWDARLYDQLWVALYTQRTVLLWDARLYDQLWVALYTQRPSYSEMHGCMISSESLSTHRDRLTLRCTAVWSALSRSLHTETVLLWDARLYDQLWVALYTQRLSYSEMHGCMISSESLSTHRDRLTLRCTAVWSALSRSLHTETVLLWDARLYDQLWVALYTQRPSYSEMHGCMISSESLSTHRDCLTLRCTAVWSAPSRSLHTETCLTLRCTAVWSALSRSLHTETVLLWDARLYDQLWVALYTQRLSYSEMHGCMISANVNESWILNC